MADVPADRRDPAPDRAPPVGVVGEHGGGLADAAGSRGEGPVLRVAEDRDGDAALRIGERERSAADAGDAQDRDVVPRVEEHDGGVAAIAVLAAVDARAFHAGDDVGVRDDKARGCDPAATLDPKPAGAAGDAHDALLRKSDGWLAQEERVGRLDGRVGAAQCREGVDAGQRIHDPLGWHLLVQPLEDHGLLHLAAQLGLPWNVERDRAEHPDERRPGRRPERRAADRVERLERRDREQRLADHAPDERADALEHHPRDNGPAERHERRVGGGGAGEELRRDPRPDVGAGDDPGERERTCDQPLAEPVQRSDGDHRGRDPVDRRHECSLDTGPARLPPRPGGVVQLVRTPACHAGGRGFESRRSRLVAAAGAPFRRPQPPESAGVIIASSRSRLAAGHKAFMS